MKKLSLKIKLLVFVLIFQTLTITISITSLYSLSGKSKESLIALENSLNQIDRIGNIKALFGVQIQEWKNTIIRGAKKEENEKHSKAFDKTAEEIIGEAKKLATLLPKQNIVFLEDFIIRENELKVKYQETREKYLKTDHFSPAEADAAVKGFDRKVSDGLKQLEAKISVESVADANESIKKKTMITIYILSSSFILIIISFLYLINLVVKDISKISIGLKENSEKVNQTSIVLAKSANELSAASTEQSASLQETSSAIEEISAMINLNSQGAKDASNVTIEGLSSAEKGKVVIGKMINAVEGINKSNLGIAEQIKQSNKEMEGIVTIIKEIGTKTKVINDIVFQTKLLSFNASVEAARAGDLGKGFAVVAEEVGNLAAMSGAAAQEITQLLDNSVVVVNEVIHNSKTKMEKLIVEANETVDMGVDSARECENVFNLILNNITNVNRTVEEISSASKEQSLGVSEVNLAIAQLDQVTHKNSKNANVEADTANILSQQSDQLNKLVKMLVETIEGSK